MHNQTLRIIVKGMFGNMRDVREGAEISYFARADAALERFREEWGITSIEDMPPSQQLEIWDSLQTLLNNCPYYRDIICIDSANHVVHPQTDEVDIETESEVEGFMYEGRVLGRLVGLTSFSVMSTSDAPQLRFGLATILSADGLEGVDGIGPFEIITPVEGSLARFILAKQALS